MFGSLDALSAPLLAAAALATPRRRTALLVLAVALLPTWSPDAPEPLLWQLRWLGIAAGVGLVAVLAARGARPYAALALGWVLLRVVAPLWPEAWAIAAPFVLWGLPAVALVGIICSPVTAVALGATAVGVAGALTGTAQGVAFGAAALAGGTLAVALDETDGRARALALLLALLGPATWGVLDTLLSTVPAHPLQASLLVVAVAAVAARHVDPGDAVPGRAAWALALLVPLAVLVPNHDAAERVAGASARLATDDVLGWRWWTRYGPAAPSSDSGADAGP